MNSWPFVIAAYALVLGATAILVIASLGAMRRAERDVEELKRR
ncbi:heme exporter protein CcmD [Sphingomicrobium marinum]|nr:heme exporter protein CcmD [Sphingomicrobium marinum]